MLSTVPKIPLPPDGNHLPIAQQEADTCVRYLESLHLVERLHRLLLDLVKDEFERLGVDELTPVQAMLLYNLGNHEVTAGELRSRGMYQGSNVSYNLKKLVAMGYVHHERSDTDRRAVRVRLSEQGVMIRQMVRNLFARHAEGLHMSGVLDDPPLEQVTLQWRRIERFWLDQIRYIY